MTPYKLPGLPATPVSQPEPATCDTALRRHAEPSDRATHHAFKRVGLACLLGSAFGGGLRGGGVAGPDKPTGEKARNWIHTIPGKGWNALWRIYGPLEAWYAKQWRPSEIEEVKQGINRTSRLRRGES